MKSLSVEMQSCVRESELKQIEKLLGENSGKHFLLHGRSGTGKSVLLKLLRNGGANADKVNVIDARSPYCKTRLGLAVGVASGFKNGEFSSFYTMAAAAREKGTTAKMMLAIDAFEESLKSLTVSPLFFYIDNVSRESERSIRWLSQLLDRVGDQRIIATASDPGLFPDSYCKYEVSSFTRFQVRKMASYWVDDIGIQEEELSSILFALSKGNATVVGLVAWALSLLRFDKRKFKNSLEELINAVIAEFDPKVRSVWLLSILAHHRVSPEIVCMFGGHEAEDYFQKDIIPTPFFAYSSSGCVGKVHDFARDLLLNSICPTKDELEMVYLALHSVIYPKLINICKDDSDVQQLVLEKLDYLVHEDVTKGAEEVGEIFDQSISEGNIARSENIAIIAQGAVVRHSEACPVRLKLIFAEYLLVEHYSDAAFRVITEISPRRMAEEERGLQVKYGLLKAKCATGPSPCKAANVFESIAELELLLQNNLGFDKLESVIRLDLGGALQLVGRNDEAINEYEAIKDLDAEVITKIRCLEEQSLLFRLMQRLDAAAKSIDEANAIRTTCEIPADGVCLYYTANIKRDLGFFEKAELLYLRSESALLDSGNLYQRCCLYGDIAWMKYLNDDISSAKLWLEKYISLASTYNFGREISEYWHMKYHFSYDCDDKTSAYTFLNTALEFARRYGNIYMQLDCLMHFVQKEIFLDNLDIAYTHLREIEIIQKRGAGIHVFHGRALIYIGDGHLKRGEQSLCYESWKRGFEEVAEFGNSHTNVQMLHDYVCNRISYFRVIGESLHKPEWPDSRTREELVALDTVFK